MLSSTISSSSWCLSARSSSSSCTLACVDRSDAFAVVVLLLATVLLASVVGGECGPPGGSASTEPRGKPRWSHAPCDCGPDADGRASLCAAASAAPTRHRLRVCTLKVSPLSSSTAQRPDSWWTAMHTASLPLWCSALTRSSMRTRHPFASTPGQSSRRACLPLRGEDGAESSCIISSCSRSMCCW